jgi:hypothetical protein
MDFFGIFLSFFYTKMEGVGERQEGAVVRKEGEERRRVVGSGGETEVRREESLIYPNLAALCSE